MTEEKKEIVLTARDLEVIYYTRGKANRVVKNVNFKVYRGETLGIVGESGSGKTTIARCIAGINHANSGQVYLGDKLVAGREPKIDKLCNKILSIFEHACSNIDLAKKYLLDLLKFNNHENLNKNSFFSHLKNKVTYIYSFSLNNLKIINGLIETVESLWKYVEAANEFSIKVKPNELKFYLSEVEKLKNIILECKIFFNNIYVAIESSNEYIFKKNKKNVEEVKHNDLENIIKKNSRNLNIIYENIISFDEIKNNIVGRILAIGYLFSNEIDRKKLLNKIERKNSKSKYKIKKIESLNDKMKSGKAFEKLEKNNRKKSDNFSNTIIEMLRKVNAKKYEVALEIINNFEVVENLWDVMKRDALEKKEKINNAYKNLNAQLNDRSNTEDEKKLLLEKFNDTKLKDFNSVKSRKIHRLIQMIYQDPSSSLNERMSIRDILLEGIVNYPELYKNNSGVYQATCNDLNARKTDDEKELTIDDITPKLALNFLANKMIERVNLLPEHLSRYPFEFSGGQRQRIGIARSLIMMPELIIADEPISALDVSIRAQVLNLLKKFREEHNLTYIFIAHDLSLMKFVSDRVLVIYKGDVVESGDATTLFENPIHPYTKSLLSAIPLPNTRENFDERKLIEYNPEIEHYDYLLDLPRMHELEPEHFAYLNDREVNEWLLENKNKKEKKNG